MKDSIKLNLSSVDINTRMVFNDLIKQLELMIQDTKTNKNIAKRDNIKLEDKVESATTELSNEIENKATELRNEVENNYLKKDDPNIMLVGRPKFLVRSYNSSTPKQSISANTWTKVIFTAELFDVGDCFDTSNYRHTPNVRGKYLYFCNVASDSTVSAGSRIYLEIRKNGVRYQQVSKYAPISNSYISANKSIIYDMNGTTDYVELYVSASTNFTLYYKGTWLYGVYIGE